MGNKWSTLQTISALIKVAAYVEAFVVIIWTLIKIFSDFFFACALLFNGIVAFLFMYAIAELILVVISIEENTQKTREIIEQQKES